MYRIVILLCAVFALLLAVLIQIWLRRGMGRDKKTVDLLAALSIRDANFRRYQYLPAIAAVLITGIPVGACISWKDAAVFLGGAAVCCISTAIAGRCAIAGISAAADSATGGEIRDVQKYSYRSGAVAGLILSFFCMAVLGGLTVFPSSELISEIVLYYALGVSTAAVLIESGGTVYSSAFALAKRSSDYCDISGRICASAADAFGSMTLAISVAILLSGCSIDYSDVFGNFSRTAAGRFPVAVFAGGAVLSAVPAMFFRGVYRKKFNSTAAPSFAAAVMISAAAVYISIRMMDAPEYGLASVTGVISALIMGELFKAFSPNARIHISGHKADRQLGLHSPVVFSLSSGLISTIIFALIFVFATFVSYYFAGHYGMALCAVGMCSMSAVNCALSWMGIISHFVNDYLTSASSRKEGEDMPVDVDLLDDICERAAAASRTYAAAASVSISIALFMQLIYTCDIHSIDILDTLVLSGIAAGCAIPFFLTGLTAQSVRYSGRVIYSLSHDERDTSAGSLRGNYIPVFLAVAFPVIIGLALGINALVGFLFGCLLSGAYILVAGNNAGEYYENSGHQILGAFIRQTLTFSLAFLPLFIKVGGILV